MRMPLPFIMNLNPLSTSFSPQQAEEIDAIFKDFPDYGWDESQERKLRAKLYKSIRSLVGESKMIEVTDSLLRLRRA